MSLIIQLMMKRTELFTPSIKKLEEAETNVIFGGRLGEYKYYDMDQLLQLCWIAF